MDVRSGMQGVVEGVLLSHGVDKNPTTHGVVVIVEAPAMEEADASTSTIKRSKQATAMVPMRSEFSLPA